MKYLISTVETYRVDTQEEAENLIKESKKAKEYTLVKSSSEIKYVKAKGEIIDSWYRVHLTKVFNTEKEPENNIKIIYDDGFNLTEDDE